MSGLILSACVENYLALLTVSLLGETQFILTELLIISTDGYWRLLLGVAKGYSHGGSDQPRSRLVL